jgi:hypothetical protein
MFSFRKSLAVAFASMAALAAIEASNATAAEFHCSVELCHVRLVAEGSSTESTQNFFVNGHLLHVGSACRSMSGEGTLAAKVATELTITNMNTPDAHRKGLLNPAST